ncbi:MAG: hypothetical protein R2774_05200 [Saprospiraceae bacterium]
MSKSPLKNPPITIVEGEGASIPSIELESVVNNSSESGMVSAPTIDPPSGINEFFDDSSGAGIWNNNKKVTGLFSTNETRNTWMYVANTGWVKLANSIDSANEALTVLATSAKVKNSNINYLLDGNQVTQIYVW